MTKTSRYWLYKIKIYFEFEIIFDFIDVYSYKFQASVLFVRNPEGAGWFADADHQTGLQIPGAWRCERRFQGAEEHRAVRPFARLLFNGYASS